MAARAAAREQARPALDALEVTWRRREGRHAPGRRRDGAQTESARSALAGALLREGRQDPRGLDDTTAPRGKHGDDAAAERVAELAERIRVQWEPPRGGGLDPSAEIPTEEDGLAVRRDTACCVHRIGQRHSLRD